ncbi:hypothetical protein Tco_1038043, partial [Tanacetum coccineum]
LKPKPVKENSSKPAPAPKPKSFLQLIDEDESTQPEPEPKPEHQGEEEEYDVERAIQMSLESFHAQGQAHVGGVAIREPVAAATRPLHVRRTPATEEASTGPSAQPQDDASTNIVSDSLSYADAETCVDTDKTNSGCDTEILQIGKEQGEDVDNQVNLEEKTAELDQGQAGSDPDAETCADTDKTNSGGDTEILQIGKEQGEDVDNQVNLEEKTAELDQGQAGSDPGKTPESRPPPEQVFMDEDQAGPDPRESCVALAVPNPGPTHDEFMANVYPNVHESLKFLADEHVILDDPLSSSGTLSSMKNLDDAYTIRGQFLNDKSTEYEARKLNVEAEVVFMVIVSIYQASSSVPPLSTPVIDLSPAKPVPSTT